MILILKISVLKVFCADLIRGWTGRRRQSGIEITSATYSSCPTRYTQCLAPRHRWNLPLVNHRAENEKSCLPSPQNNPREARRLSIQSFILPPPTARPSFSLLFSPFEPHSPERCPCPKNSAQKRQPGPPIIQPDPLSHQPSHALPALLALPGPSALLPHQAGINAPHQRQRKRHHGHGGAGRDRVHLGALLVERARKLVAEHCEGGAG